MSAELEALVAALRCLPEVDRLVYLLAARDGLGHEDIGGRLGLGTKEVERHLARALLALDRALDGG